MASTATKRVVQTKTYKDAKGEEQKNYLEIGVLIENEKGYQSIKMNVLPLPDANGDVWLNLYPIEKETKKAK